MPKYKGPEVYESKDRHLFSIKESDSEGTFEGHASIFGKRDLQDEVVESGAFKRTITHHKGKFPLLSQHNPEEPIGSIQAEEDSRGLKVKGSLLLALSKAKDTHELIKADILTSLSIGHRVIKDEVDRITGVRRLKEIDLWEVSVVTFPALPSARITRVKAATEKLIDPMLSSEDGLIELAASLIGANSLSSLDISEEEVEAVKMKCANAYRRMGRRAPWEAQDTFEEMVRHLKEISRFADCEKLDELFGIQSRSPSDSCVKPFDWMDKMSEPVKQPFAFLDEWKQE